MAITSQITMKPLVGTDPIGYQSFPAITNPPQHYVSPHRVTIELDELTAFPLVIDTEANKTEFLNAVKVYLDANYADTNYTDSTRDYFVDYTVINAKRTYKAPSSSIWEKRDYVWIVDISIRVMTDF